MINLDFKTPFDRRLENWIVWWIDLICAMIRIVTFGVWYPQIDFDVLFYFARKNIARRSSGG